MDCMIMSLLNVEIMNNACTVILTVENTLVVKLHISIFGGTNMDCAMI
jgi:hypothetical protein